MRGKEVYMAMTFIGKLNVPNYLALSTDIGLDDTITGVNIVGATVLLTDTYVWKIVKSDLTLEDYALPISFNGSVDIGAVHLDQNLTDSIAIHPVSGAKAVTVPGTAEALSGTNIYFISMIVQPKVGNIGNVYFGDSGVDKTTSQQIIIAPSTTAIIVDAPIGYKNNLANWYIDAINANDGVRYTYQTE
jgi:hypothetical protein